MPRIELASASGVSATTIQHLEEGRTANPTMETILALCGALHVSPIEFLKDAYPDLQEKPPVAVIEDADSVSLKEMVALLQGFASASDLKRAMVLTILVPVRGNSLSWFQKNGIKIDLETAKKFRELVEGLQTLE
jgi:transcriptional regulator with XRE-family HTH domain